MGDDSQAPQKEIWANGAAYEAYVGGWSRPVARVFLNWLNVPAKAHWLDVGCGTGAFSQTILDRTYAVLNQIATDCTDFTDSERFGQLFPCPSVESVA